MENQNDRKIWNDRWKRQILEWRQECERLVAESNARIEQAEALVALMKLAKSQIKPEPPE